MQHDDNISMLIFKATLRKKRTLVKISTLFAYIIIL